MRGKWSVLLWAVIMILGCLATLLCLRYLIYVSYCTGVVGEREGWLHYIYQCSCPPAMENTRIQKLYSEHAEIMFSGCDNVGPIPSPDGQKIAVINYEKPDEPYMWFLQTDERMPFTWPGGGDLIWLSGDFLFTQWGLDTARVLDLNARTEYPIPVKTDIRLDSGEVDPAVIAALREAGYVLLTGGEVAAISPDALASPEHSFVTPYEGFGYERWSLDSFEQMRQFLRNQDIDYLDYIDRRGTDVLLNPLGIPYVDLPSPDGRFFYRVHSGSEDGIHLAETGEKIVGVDGIRDWAPIGWVDDGVLLAPIGGEYLYYDMFDIGRCWISEPWLKLRIPPEYEVSDTGSDHD